MNCNAVANTRPEAASDIAAYTRTAQRIRRRHADHLALLAPGAPDHHSLHTTYLALRAQGMDAAAALRTLRQLVLERLMVLDCDGGCPLATVTATMSDLADVALRIACEESRTALQAVHGVPLGAHGGPAQLFVIGMGKLGAAELNVSSDIDLIYLYDHDGETSGDAYGRGRIANQEFFARQVRAMYALLGDSTEHGFVFRVDLALRPNGNSGPPAVSLAALEEYFQVQGREWERFAWLKSRLIVPDPAEHPGHLQSLQAIVLPFVFRKYLDYGVFEALRTLHRQIRTHAARRSAGHPERHHDVKLSRGGIREIEFTVQVLQVVRGGQFPELRTRATLDALQRIVQAGLMQDTTAQALAQAYTFLRRVEHRIQYLDDQQTHTLPERDSDLAWLAQSLNFTGTCDFLAEMDRHRELAAIEFDALLGSGHGECKGCRGKNAAEERIDLENLLGSLRGAFGQRLQPWLQQPRFLALRDSSRERLGRVVQRTAQWIRHGEVSEEAAVRMADWLEPLLRRESYLSLLLERPAVHQRLLHMLGAARWPARYLVQHPGVIDELADDAMFGERFDAKAFEAELELRRAALRHSGEDDDEALLNLLRRAHHAEVFRTLARDVEGHLHVEQVADDLSALAVSVLAVTTRWCWERLRHRHRDAHRLGIIAYGKLGGLELGYGSDLDLVFVYEDDDERAPDVYGALVRKLIHWLTVKTGEGDLYETDTALRPNGNSGLLITPLHAYADYQQRRGSNTAWTWEHQAMTRARWVLGDNDLCLRFEAVRDHVLCCHRDTAALRQEVAAMRDRLNHAHPVRPGSFDLKYSPGGMVDIEFAVQYLVLSQGAAHPELRQNAGNIALLQRAQQCGLLPGQTGTEAARAYRQLRQMQHRARLDEASTQVSAAMLGDAAGAGLALWAALFGLNPPSGSSAPGG